MNVLCIMNKINYQKELEKELNIITKAGKVPRLLLHVCCVPCSSYVLEYLTQYFDITALFYNPNIDGVSEYNHRARELRRFISEKKFINKVDVKVCDYCPEEFFNNVTGLEDCLEGGARCFKCYRLRLEKTATIASNKNYDYFTTTLSISPLKNSAKLNEIGKELSDKYNIPYLFSDFKKKEGYKRSIELSKEYNLYRQNYCGCVFSKRESLRKEE